MFSQGKSILTHNLTHAKGATKDSRVTYPLDVFYIGLALTRAEAERKQVYMT